MLWTFSYGQNLVPNIYAVAVSFCSLKYSIFTGSEVPPLCILLRGSGAAQRVGGPTLAMECEKRILKHIANVNDTYGGLGASPRKISNVRNSESVFLDTFTMLLK